MTPSLDALLAIDPRPTLPASGGRPIGIVGAGAIVVAGHLPAYRTAGLQVTAIADIDRARATRVARDFGIESVYESAAQLIGDPRVEIVDIAVTPEAQAEIIPLAIRAGKHVLAQKPFSEDLATAVAMVDAAEHAGIQLAINQQMRWDQVIAVTKVLMDAGWYGQPTGALFDIDVNTNWDAWPWLASRPRLEYFYHSIHYIDAMRHLFGEPAGVLARTGRYPGQTAHGETRTYTVYDYTDEFQVVVLANHNNWSARPRAIVRCQGTDGQSEGTLGVLYEYPVGRPDRFSFWSRTTHPEHTFTRDFTQRWIPDAFLGPMADLQNAIAQKRKTVINARDNLNTLRIVHAAYQSASENRRIEINGAPL